MAALASPDPEDLRVSRVYPVHLVPLEPQASPADLARGAAVDNQDPWETRVNLDCRDLLASPDRKDHLDLQVRFFSSVFCPGQIRVVDCQVFLLRKNDNGEDSCRYVPSWTDFLPVAES